MNRCFRRHALLVCCASAAWCAWCAAALFAEPTADELRAEAKALRQQAEKALAEGKQEEAAAANARAEQITRQADDLARKAAEPARQAKPTQDVAAVLPEFAPKFAELRQRAARLEREGQADALRNLRAELYLLLRAAQRAQYLGPAQAAAAERLAGEEAAAGRAAHADFLKALGGYLKTAEALEPPRPEPPKQDPLPEEPKTENPKVEPPKNERPPKEREPPVQQPNQQNQNAQNQPRQAELAKKREHLNQAIQNLLAGGLAAEADRVRAELEKLERDLGIAPAQAAWQKETQELRAQVVELQKQVAELKAALEASKAERKKE